MSIDIYPSEIHGLTWTIMRSPAGASVKPSAPSGQAQPISQTVNPMRKWTLVYDYIYGDFPSSNNTRPYLPYTDFDTLEGFFLAHYESVVDFLFEDPQRNSLGPGVLTTPWTPNTPVGVNQGILDPSHHWQRCITAGVTAASPPTWNDSGGITTETTGVRWQDVGGGYTTGFPNLLAQLQLWNDGSGNYYSPIQYNVGGLFYEDITDLNPPMNYPYSGDSIPITVYANGVVLGQNVNFVVLGPGLAIDGNASSGLYIKFLTTPTPPITVTCNWLYRVRFADDSLDFEEFLHDLFTIGGQGAKNGSGQLILITSRPPYFGS